MCANGCNQSGCRNSKIRLKAIRFAGRVSLCSRRKSWNSRSGWKHWVGESCSSSTRKCCASTTIRSSPRKPERSFRGTRFAWRRESGILSARLSQGHRISWAFARRTKADPQSRTVKIHSFIHWLEGVTTNWVCVFWFFLFVGFLLVILWLGILSLILAV